MLLAFPLKYFSLGSSSILKFSEVISYVNCECSLSAKCYKEYNTWNTHVAVSSFSPGITHIKWFRTYQRLRTFT